MELKTEILIIGGGASGLTAALTASEDPHSDVHLAERQARVARKLLATGNGRCNRRRMRAAFSFSKLKLEVKLCHFSIPQ